MSSAYTAQLDDDITQEDLDNFYNNVQSGYLKGSEDLSDFDYDAADGDLEDGSNNHFGPNGDNEEASDDSEDLQRQLELYSQGRIGELAKMDETRSIKSPNRMSTGQSPNYTNQYKIKSISVQKPRKRQVIHTQKSPSTSMPSTGPKKLGNNTRVSANRPMKRTANNNTRNKDPETQGALAKIRQLRKAKEAQLKPSPNSVLSHPFLGSMPVNTPKTKGPPKQSSPSSIKSPQKSIASTVTTASFSEKDFVAQFKQDGGDNNSQQIVPQSNASVPAPVLSDMHQSMGSWLELDDEIKEINKVLKILKQKQKDLTGNLLKEMKDHQVGYLTEGTQQLKYNVTFPKQGYKKSYIQEKLAEYLKDPNLAGQLTDYLENSRPRNERVNLKRAKFDPLKGTNKSNKGTK